MSVFRCLGDRLPLDLRGDRRVKPLLIKTVYPYRKMACRMASHFFCLGQIPRLNRPPRPFKNRLIKARSCPR